MVNERKYVEVSIAGTRDEKDRTIVYKTRFMSRDSQKLDLLRREDSNLMCELDFVYDKSYSAQEILEEIEKKVRRGKNCTCFNKLSVVIEETFLRSN